MAKISVFSIYIIFLIPMIFTLDLQIIDEDYLEVAIGGEKQKLKLLIDPVGHFTYLFNKANSTTVRPENKEYSFSNNFGTFKGQWESDFIFPTPDHQFGFTLTYLMVKDKGDSVLNCDGVIGLGYSDNVPENANIYKILGSMKEVLSFKNVMTYDKNKKKLILGRVPDPDSNNPVPFDLSQNDPKNPLTLVTLSKIGFYPKNSKKPTYIDVEQPAKLGLIPVLIAPHSSKKLLFEGIMGNMTTDLASVKEIENNNKFFNDVSFTNPNSGIKKQALMMFGKIGYKFEHTWTEKDTYTSAIRLGDETEAVGYWYIGIDKLNVNRMDFDFDKKKVILFSTTAAEIGKTKYPYLFKSLLITIVITIILIILIRLCCSKKRQNEIKEGEELLEL
ncbi:MAG: hypothetical protein MJ252_17105 [archaeon]|nr:hypothetical protein [archaeon]